MNNKLCFVIMGYGKKTDPESNIVFDLDKTYHNIIKPAVENAGYTCIRGDELKESGLIDKSMYGLLIHADLVIADISTYNPNAIYELGIRHAVRPHATIIMKEEKGKIPFDLSHSKIFHYAHLGADIGASEAVKRTKQLTDLINELGLSCSIDSPLFHFIKDLSPYTLSTDDYDGLIKEIADKEQSVFAWTQQAKKEMKESHFLAAEKLWKKAVAKMENEAYYIQQQALCKYKSKLPTEKEALIDALLIINKLNSEDNLSNDPETLGITGAVYKNLWYLDEDKGYLNRAIENYENGFKLNRDYYTGENYALCLNIKASIEKDPEEKIYYRIEAKKTREEIVKMIKAYEDEENFKDRNDVKWLYATMANSLFAINDTEQAKKYEQKFFDKVDTDWEKETYLKSKTVLLNLLKITLT